MYQSLFVNEVAGLSPPVGASVERSTYFPIFESAREI